MGMARIKGVESKEAGWCVRLFYAMVRRQFHRVMLPVKVTAHPPGFCVQWGRWSRARRLQMRSNPV